MLSHCAAESLPAVVSSARLVVALDLGLPTMLDARRCDLKTTGARWCACWYRSRPLYIYSNFRYTHRHMGKLDAGDRHGY